LRWGKKNGKKEGGGQVGKGKGEKAGNWKLRNKRVGIAVTEKLPKGKQKELLRFLRDSGRKQWHWKERSGSTEGCGRGKGGKKSNTLIKDPGKKKKDKRVAGQLYRKKNGKRKGKTTRLVELQQWGKRNGKAMVDARVGTNVPPVRKKKGKKGHQKD